MTALRGPYVEGLQVQARIVAALIMRSIMLRYGRANIGFLWVILEPMILTIGVMGMWSILKSPYEHGIHILALVLTGYMPLTLFRHISGAGPFLLRSSLSLLYHRRISYIDLMLARAALEFAGTTTALAVVYAVIVLTGLLVPMYDVGLLLFGWVSLAFFSFALMTFFAAISEYSEAAERFIQPFQYLMLPISGTFFMVEWLPKRGQDLIWYNPTVHCYEMFRAGYFGESVVTHYTWWYPQICSLALLFVGLRLLEDVRDKLHSS